MAPSIILIMKIMTVSCLRDVPDVTAAELAGQNFAIAWNIWIEIARGGLEAQPGNCFGTRYSSEQHQCPSRRAKTPALVGGETAEDRAGIVIKIDH